MDVKEVYFLDTSKFERDWEDTPHNNGPLFTKKEIAAIILIIVLFDIFTYYRLFS